MKLKFLCLAPTLLAASAALLAQPLPEETFACLDQLEAAQASSEYGDDSTPVIGVVCTDLYTALYESDWTSTLPTSEMYNIDRPGLEALIELASHYETPPALTPSADSLNGIVEQLKPFDPDEEPSLWSRFVEWVEELFESDSDEESWLSEWLDSFSLSEVAVDNLVRIIAFVAVLIVLAILINELRLGGAFIRGRQRLRPLAPGSAAVDPEIPVDMDAVMQAATVRRKVELMLNLVVSRLQKRHGDSLHHSRTHRELMASAGQLGSDVQEPFTDVVRAAERVTYASWEPDDEELDRVLESGRAVVAQASDDAEPAE